MAPSLEESSDPTLSTNGQADEANGPVPEPFERYGKPLPSQWIPLYQEPMRTPTRRVKVVTIGAGVSAMGFAYQLHHAHKLDEYVDHVVYEANKDIGGTWLVNTYPGVACDVPAHVYCFPFEVCQIPFDLGPQKLSPRSPIQTGLHIMPRAARSSSTLNERWQSTI